MLIKFLWNYRTFFYKRLARWILKKNAQAISKRIIKEIVERNSENISGEMSSEIGYLVNTFQWDFRRNSKRIFQTNPESDWMEFSKKLTMLKLIAATISIEISEESLKRIPKWIFSETFRSIFQRNCEEICYGMTVWLSKKKNTRETPTAIVEEILKNKRESNSWNCRRDFHFANNSLFFGWAIQ